MFICSARKFSIFGKFSWLIAGNIHRKQLIARKCLEDRSACLTRRTKIALINCIRSPQVALLLLTALTICGGSANAQVCPPVGQDTDCGTIITITDTGASVSVTGQGPYDGLDDTLVGVVNKSSLPIHALGLQSLLTIFALDGDGIDTFGIPGNVRDGSGYGGPNAYFNNIDPGFMAGVVNFVVPLAPFRGTAYFSLEQAIDAAISCQQVVNGSVPKPPGGGTTITAAFTPQVSLTLDQAAAYCGFKYFNWIQKITHLPDPSAFFQINTSKPAAPIHLTSTSTPFNDPPPGGYTYFQAMGWNWNSYPFYWDANSKGSPWSLDQHEINNTLTFFDSPQDPCFVGGADAGTSICNGKTAPAGSYVGFTTHLAGMSIAGTPVDLGIGFTWTDTFHGGSAGGISTATFLPADPTGGTGGITVTSVTAVTDYQYNGITVTTVNGGPAVGPTITSLTATPDVLWPPNRKLVPVSLAIAASDGTTTAPACSITAVSSNEPPTVPGEIDWSVSGPLTLDLRAEREGTGNGRIYTIVVKCSNASPFSATKAVTVTVPHDQSNK